MRDTILHGDALATLRALPDASVDAVVTDPPWMDYATGRYDASAWHKPITILEPEHYCAELYRVLRDRSALLLWCRWDCFDRHAQALAQAGFRVRNCIVWAKPNHTAGDLYGNLGNQHEMAVFATKGRWTRHDKRETNLWIEPHLFSRAKRFHPTEKPLNLMRRAVRLTTPPGGVVLDPFAGSGSTCVAAKQLERHYLGIEREATYVEITRARLATSSTLALATRPRKRPRVKVTASIAPLSLWQNLPA